MTTQDALSCTSTDSEDNDSDVCPTGSPGAKPQPSFAGRGHSIAKRRRGPACEPSVQPGESLLFSQVRPFWDLGRGGGGAGRGSLRSYPRPGQLPCWISTPSTMGQELLVSAMLGNPLLHSFGDMFSPCWRTSLLCHEECLHKVSLPFISVTPPPTALRTEGLGPCCSLCLGFSPACARCTPSPLRLSSNVPFTLL